MKWIGFAAAVIILVAAILYFFKHHSANIEKEEHQYYVQLYVLLFEAKPFHPEDLVRTFKEMWGIDIGCGEVSGTGGKHVTGKCYVVAQGPDKNNIVLTWCIEPLDKEGLNVLVQASEGGFTNNQIVSASEVNSLKNHKAYFQMDYFQGPEDPKERMLFTAKLLLALSKGYRACGYVDSSAQAYTPLSRYPSGIFDRTEITVRDLFKLFVNVQEILDKGDVDIHTHGMDQFWLPDVQMISSREDVDRDLDLLRNAAIYMIDTGKAMKEGEMGDVAGREFGVHAVKPNNEHPFGFYGAINLRTK